MLTANKIYKILKENGKTDKNFTEWLNEQKYLFETNIGECPDANKEMFLQYLNYIIENENINQENNNNNNLKLKSMENNTNSGTIFNLKEFVTKNKKPIIWGTAIVTTMVVGTIIYKKVKANKYYYGYYGDGYDNYNYSNRDGRLYII